MIKLAVQDLATEAFLNVYRWTKVVLVEKSSQPASPSPSMAPIIDPKVSIEKKRYQMSRDEEDGVEDCDTEYQFPFDPDWELDRGRLKIHSVLGEGQFGRVMYATLDSGGSEVPVAVKVSVPTYNLLSAFCILSSERSELRYRVQGG